MNIDTNQNDFGDGIFSIPESNMAKFEAAIAKLSKKSIKCGGTEITPIIFGYKMVTNNKGLEYKVYEVLLGGDAPKINGWEFIACISHAHGELGNIVRTLPGKSVPKEYQNAGNQCSHCSINRFRRDTYLLQNDVTNEIKQVGRTCLKDFLGHETPENIAKMAEVMGYAYTCARGYTNEQGLSHNYLNLEMYLNLVALAIREKGYFVSRALASEKDITSTSDIAIGLLMHNSNYVLTDDDIKLAADSISWAQNLGEDGHELSDYEHNIKVLADSGSIEFRSIGYAASIVGSYKRIISAPYVATERKVSNYIGTPKDKIEVTVVLKYVTGTQSRFGDGFMYLFEDINGNVLKWFTTTNIDIDIGVDCILAGKVKSHDEYKNVKSTVVTHCKIAKIK